MAASLLSHEVSDLCIGRQPLQSLPITSTVGEALFSLRLYGDALFTVNISNEVMKATTITGKICMVDLICHLCSKSNVNTPSSALKNPISALIPMNESSSLISVVEPNSSILQAIDLILDDKAQSLVVPIVQRQPPYSNERKKKLPHEEFCWLTQEDLIRYFLNNIGSFSSISDLSITTLGLVRPALLSIFHQDSAISALPLVRSALISNTSVAVITKDGKLIGEISPSTLSTCDETIVPAVASLSVGELMTYIDCCSCGLPSDTMVETIKRRLTKNGMEGTLELMNVEGDVLLSLSSSSSLVSSSDEEEATKRKNRRRRRRGSGSYSARMGRRSTEEVVVCHPESSLVAVMAQALAHRVSYMWVVEEDCGLLGIVTFEDVLRVFREQV